MATLIHLSLAVVVFVVGCAKPRPIRPLLADSSRLEAKHLDGTFLFLKTVVQVHSPSAAFASFAPGQYLEHGKLVRFVAHENKIDIVSVDPLFQEQSTAPQSGLLSSFPAEWVDVERARTPDGEPTHEEVENTQDRAWDKRAFVRMDLLKDTADSLDPKTRSAALVLEPEVDLQRGAINFEVERHLEDGTSLTVHYSFLKYTPNARYTQRDFSIEEQIQFGFFATQTYRLDAFDRFAESTRRSFLNRWDTTKTIVFYFSPGFPSHLKDPIRQAYAEWGEILKSAVGDLVLEPIRENTGQRLGDLRHSLIVYDNSESSAHGVLGYAPLMTNPRSGEILKADVILYGKVLKDAAFKELFWEKSRRISPDSPSTDTGTSLINPVELLHTHTVQDLSNHITRINDGVLKRALSRDAAQGGSDTLEKEVFSGIFKHEFGHALGLRHNFMSTPNGPAHNPNTVQNKSIMGYGFLEDSFPSIGPYDRAAILFGYSPNAEVRNQQLKKGFSYCSDEEIFTSRAAMCQLYDTGSNLTDLIQKQLQRYFSHYEIGNLRLDRIDFGGSPETYRARILGLLLPIRQAYDNAESILQAFNSQDYAAVWSLARQRVEADSTALASALRQVSVEYGSIVQTTDKGPVSVSRHLTRTLDMNKVRQVVEDALEAKQEAVSALRQIVLDSKRPDFDSTDGVQNRLQSRGILPDKLLALSLISAPSEHPLAKNRFLSPYSAPEEAVPSLFSSLLSNTIEISDPDGGTEPYFRIQQFDPSLRAHALKLLSEEIAVFGRHPEALELIQVHTTKLADSKNTPDWGHLQSARTESQEFYRTLMIDELSRSDFSQGATNDFSFTDRSAYEQTRNRFERAFTFVDDETVLSAPVSVGVDGVRTATGLLIRNNLNVAEDYLEAVTKTRRQIQDELLKDRPRTFVNSLMALNALNKRQDALHRYITGERLFLIQMYLVFAKEKRAP